MFVVIVRLVFLARTTPACVLIISILRIPSLIRFIALIVLLINPMLPILRANSRCIGSELCTRDLPVLVLCLVRA